MDMDTSHTSRDVHMKNARDTRAARRRTVIRCDQCLAFDAGYGTGLSSRAASPSTMGFGRALRAARALAYQKEPTRESAMPTAAESDVRSPSATAPYRMTMSLFALVSTMKVVAVTSCCTRSPAYEIATPFAHEAATTPHCPSVSPHSTLPSAGGSPSTAPALHASPNATRRTPLMAMPTALFSSIIPGLERSTGSCASR
mmetsp:Transcript_7365/g.23565  ORF Transcript_7365/g.23565 Transcript_7365/m.23565 type:complete len:200 (+) Transcript_7365:82-681(+)